MRQLQISEKREKPLLTKGGFLLIYGKTHILLDNALREARKIEPELLARGLAFARDVLSKVDGFPTHKLDECTVIIAIDDQGETLVIDVPMHGVGGSDVTESYLRKVAIKDRFESLPQVARVDTVGGIVSGIISFNVVLELDQIPAQDPSQAVE